MILFLKYDRETKIRSCLGHKNITCPDKLKVVKSVFSLLKGCCDTKENQLWIEKILITNVFVETSFKCDSCGDVFSNNEELISHQKSHVVKYYNIHKCEVCKVNL